MKRKIRIFSNIAIICLSVCMFAFGVYAANQVSVTTSGTVTFNATGVYAKITGSISGSTETNLTYAELIANADGTITGDITTWASKNVTFDSDNEITLTITVQNLATETGRVIYAALYDIDQPAELKTTMLMDSEDYLASTVTEIAVGGTATFTVTMTPRDLNTSFTTDYEYLLDLDSEKLNAERIESKIKTGVNNSEYGSISATLDETKTQLTLTATTTGTNKFLGFVAGNTFAGKFVYALFDSSSSLSTTINLNVFDYRSFYAIFYSRTDTIGDPNTGDYEMIAYVGTNYAEWIAAEAISTSTGGIPETCVYCGDVYNVALTLGNHPMSPWTSSVTNYVIPSHISSWGMQGDYNHNVNTLVFPSTVTYLNGDEGAFYMDNYSSTNTFKYYIDSKFVLSQLTYKLTYFGPWSSSPNFYINENIVDYTQYNEWFSANYTKATTTTEYNGANYYLYTYTPAS